MLKRIISWFLLIMGLGCAIRVLRVGVFVYPEVEQSEAEGCAIRVL